MSVGIGAPPHDRVLTRRTLPIYLAAWLPMLLAYAVGIAGYGVRPSDALISASITALAAAALGVLVIEGAARLAVRRTSVARLLGVHGVRAVAYACAWVGTTLAQMLAFAPPDATHRYLTRNAPWEWVSGLFLYGVVAAVGHAVAISRQLRERETAATRAELHALRAQLDPHFLFNTLHSLIALARRDPAAVERGLETFGTLLRYVLHANHGRAADTPGARPAGDDDVALAEELAFVRDYLALERLRLGDRLRVEETFDDDALECAVPPFTLQPLVENAIRHGLAPRASGGTLRLAAAVHDDGRLAIEVADDGVGCDPDEPAGAGGLGLDLVRRRMLARFGASARVDIVTAPAEGFRVRISVPAELPASRMRARHGAKPRAAPAHGRVQPPAAAASLRSATEEALRGGKP
jgi:signal transduction histidine kinase